MEMETWRVVSLTAGMFWCTIAMMSLLSHAQERTSKAVILGCQDIICILGTLCGFAGALKQWRPSLIIFACGLLPYITRGFTLLSHRDHRIIEYIYALLLFFMSFGSAVVLLRCYVLQEDTFPRPRVRWLNPVHESLSRTPTFYSVQSNSVNSLEEPLLCDTSSLPSMLERPLAPELDELTDREKQCIEALQRRLPHEMSLRRWLGLAHACKLDVEKSVALWQKFSSKIEQHALCSVSRDDVIKNYQSGFSVRAGRDRLGRPLIWVRVKYIFPAKIPLDVGIVSTWAAMDAVQQDVHSLRVGARFVYDMAGMGYANCVTMKLLDFKEGVETVAMSHPTVASSSVLLVDAPAIFRHCWNLASPFVPTALLDSIEFVSTSSLRPWYHDFFDQDQLPEYMGGPYRDNDPTSTDTYLDWIEMRLADNLEYSPALSGVRVANSPVL